MAYIQKNNPFKPSPTKDVKVVPKETGDVFNTPVNPKIESLTTTASKAVLPKFTIKKDTWLPPAPGVWDASKDKWDWKELEQKINRDLGNPKQKASEIAGELAGPYSEVDRLRHTLAAALTAKKIGFIGANILGLAHEVVGPSNDPGEHVSDMVNNFIGSIVGKLPFQDEEQMVNTVKWLNQRGWLSEYGTTGEEEEEEFESRDVLTDQLWLDQMEQGKETILPEQTAQEKIRQ